jgi:hypothetical protein
MIATSLIAFSSGCRLGESARRESADSTLRLTAVGVENSTTRKIESCTIRTVDRQYERTFHNVGSDVNAEHVYPLEKDRPVLRSNVEVEWKFADGESKSTIVDFETDIRTTCQPDDRMTIAILPSNEVQVKRSNP